MNCLLKEFIEVEILCWVEMFWNDNIVILYYVTTKIQDRTLEYKILMISSNTIGMMFWVIFFHQIKWELKAMLSAGLMDSSILWFS